MANFIKIAPAEFQQLALLRVEDAQALCHSNRWSAAYYVAGYALEAAIKACIAKGINPYTFNRKQDFFVHDLGLLVDAAGLRDDLDRRARTDTSFEANWGIAKDWNEQSRYSKKERNAAEALLTAITDPSHGILDWLRNHW